MISSILLFSILCLSLVTPAGGWGLPKPARSALVADCRVLQPTRSRLVLSFFPVNNNEDLLRIVHRDEPEEPVIIHKDTDEAEEAYLEEAHAELEELLGGAQMRNPVGLFQDTLPQRRMRTPREDHFLLTALDSLKKLSPQVQDDEDLYFSDSWPLLGV